MSYNAKMGLVFVKARITYEIGNSIYYLEEMQGESIGFYRVYAKELRQS